MNPLLEDEYKVISEAKGTATVSILNNNMYHFVIRIPSKNGKDLFISKSYALNDMIKEGIENASDIYGKFHLKIDSSKLNSFLKSFDSDLKAGTVTEEEILEQLQMDIKDFVDVEFQGMSR